MKPNLAELSSSVQLWLSEASETAFWIAKALSTALGESTSDFLVHRIGPYGAVLIGGVALLAGLGWQFSVGRYMAWSYWFAVVMVAISGTLAADAVHVGLGVPYIVSTVFYGLVLAAVFVAWHRTEGTLSIHSIYTRRRRLCLHPAVRGLVRRLFRQEQGAAWPRAR